jgi:hypothetical protein
MNTARECAPGVVRAARGLLLLALPWYFVAALYPFVIELPRWERNAARLEAGALVLEAPGRVSGPGAVVVAAARAAQRLDLELELVPARRLQHGPARVFELGTDHERAVLTVGQDGEDLVVRLRRPGADPSGTPPLRLPARFAAGDAARLALRVAVTSTALQVACGAERSELALDASPFAAWDEAPTLVLGDSPIGERPWLGRIERARLTAGRLDVDLLADAQVGLDDGRFLWPKRWRQLLAWRFVPPVVGKEVFVNVLGFLPLGCLAAASTRRRPLLVAGLVAAAVSLGMELSQLAFAERMTSLLDLVANVLGGLLGALAWRVRTGMLRSR